MFILSAVGWALTGLIVGLLSMIAWSDRRRTNRERRQSARFDPYMAEARAYLAPMREG